MIPAVAVRESVLDPAVSFPASTRVRFKVTPPTVHNVNGTVLPEPMSLVDDEGWIEVGIANGALVVHGAHRLRITMDSSKQFRVSLEDQ
jgi:hypothetical protein